MEADGLAAGAGDLVYDTAAAGIVEVGYHDFGAFARQRRCTCSTYSRPATGYDGNLTLYLAHDVLPLRSNRHVTSTRFLVDDRNHPARFPPTSRQQHRAAS